MKYSLITFDKISFMYIAITQFYTQILFLSSIVFHCFSLTCTSLPTYKQINHHLILERYPSSNSSIIKSMNRIWHSFNSFLHNIAKPPDFPTRSITNSLSYLNFNLTLFITFFVFFSFQIWKSTQGSGVWQPPLTGILSKDSQHLDSSIPKLLLRSGSLI